MRVMEPKVVDPDASIMGLPQAEFIKLAESVLIVIPHRAHEGIRASLAENHTIWSSCGSRIVCPEDSFGGFIEVTRAQIAKQFLDYCQEHPGVDKMVMIDNDETVDWQIPYKLAMWDLPIVSGVVCNWTFHRGIFACFTLKDEYGVPRFPSARYTKVLPAKGLVEAYSVGTGLLCVKQEVFKSIFDSGEMPFEVSQEIRRESLKSGVLKHGEDIAFCRQANRAGYKIYVDLAAHAVHHKMTDIVWPPYALSDQLDPADLKVDMREYFHGS